MDIIIIIITTLKIYIDALQNVYYIRYGDYLLYACMQPINTKQLTPL